LEKDKENRVKATKKKRCPDQPRVGEGGVKARGQWGRRLQIGGGGRKSWGKTGTFPDRNE